MVNKSIIIVYFIVRLEYCIRYMRVSIWPIRGVYWLKVGGWVGGGSHSPFYWIVRSKTPLWFDQLDIRGHETMIFKMM